MKKYITEKEFNEYWKLHNRYNEGQTAIDEFLDYHESLIKKYGLFNISTGEILK